MLNLMQEIDKEQRKKKVPHFDIGDIVDVHVKIKEGDKERIQIFNGVVIGRKGSGIHETFTVRRIVHGEGVERVFPVHAPVVANVVVKKRGQVRRAKLYYLRDRTGKSTKVREQLGAIPGFETFEAEAPPTEAPKSAPSKTEEKPSEETKK
jgi:large subunit ribosomal protein L19